MPINLSNVNISIQQFQAISNGKYNAGEVRLASETSLEKVNNRVHFTNLNKVDLSHSEVLAVKQAFVKALTAGGVGEEELSRVRRELGLGADKGMDVGLKQRSIKPLSRQQVREILDRNAEAINAHAGEGTVRTSGQIYAGVGARTRQFRAATRDAVNADLAATRAVTEHKAISLFQTLVAGDVDFIPREDRAKLLRMAKDSLDAVLRQSGGHPREGVPAKIAWGVGGEKRLSMETGLDEAAFARKLEDVIVRLSAASGPLESMIALRAEFLAVPRDGRLEYFENLLQNGENVQTDVRTIAVALLQEAGVADYESLSLPNRLPDAIATTLVRNLLALPQGASAEEARGQLDMVRETAGEPVANGTYVPATSTADFNKAVADSFAGGNNKPFGAFATLASDLLAEARAVFGADIVKEDAPLMAFFGVVEVRRAIAALGENVRATADGLRDALRAEVMKNAANRAVFAAVAARQAELGIGLDSPLVAGNALVKRDPGLVDRLAACRNPAEVAAAIGEAKDRLDAEIRRAEANEKGKKDFADMVHAALASKMGVPSAAFGENTLPRGRLSDIAEHVADAISMGEILCDTPDQIRQAYLEKVERFAAERAAILKKVDALPLSDATKADLKTWLLSQDKVSFLDLDAILAEAAKIDFAALAGALRNKAPKADVYAAMHTLATAVRQALPRLLDVGNGALGAEETTNVSTIILIAGADRHPGFRRDLTDFLARPEVQEDDFNDPETPAGAASAFLGVVLPPADEAKAELQEKIDAGAPPPVLAQALVRAVRAEGIDLSPEETAAAFAAGTPLAKYFAEILHEFSGELTPANLEFLARGALHHFNEQPGELQKMVETARDSLVRNVVMQHFYSLPERYIDASHDAVEELRGKYGEELVPEDAAFPDISDLIPFGTRLRSLADAAHANRGVITVAQFREAALEELERALAEKIVGAEIAAVATRLGLAKPPSYIARYVIQRHPEIADAFRRAKTQEAVRAAVADAGETIQAAVEQERELAEFVSASTEVFVTNLATELHLPKEEVGSFAFASELSSRLQDLKTSIQNGTHPGCRYEGFSSAMAFNELVDRFVQTYVERFVAIDALQGVSDETKNALRDVVKKETRPDKPFVDAARAQRIAAKVDGAALLAVLGDPNATDEARIAAIAKYADAIDKAVVGEFRDQMHKGGLGPDDFIPILANVRAFVTGATPGLSAALERLSGEPFAANVQVVFQSGEHQAHPLRASVASSLF